MQEFVAMAQIREFWESRYHREKFSFNDEYSMTQTVAADDSRSWYRLRLGTDNEISYCIHLTAISG